MLFVPKHKPYATTREAEPSKSIGISREQSSEEKIDRRRYSTAKRDSSTINLLDSFECLRDLIDTLCMSVLTTRHFVYVLPLLLLRFDSMHNWSYFLAIFKRAWMFPRM